MRRLQPLYLAAAVTLALAGSAMAQTTTAGTVRASTTASGASGPSGTTTGAPAASTSGGCVGTGGSSCTATTSSSADTTTTGSTTTSTPTPGVTAPAGASNSVTTLGSPAGSSGSAMGTNQTNVDPATTRPGSFEPGGAFGPNTGSTGTTATLPGSTGAFVLPATGLEGMPQGGNQQNVVIQQPQPLQQRAATPMFDEVAREGRAKERARKARGEEPRIIGIAPRTDRDLTHQMPDDPIIRY